tara:strand:- start:180 stop:308 length:129 start_codon:yes stop_codon:yes gene_type:complete
MPFCTLFPEHQKAVLAIHTMAIVLPEFHPDNQFIQKSKKNLK